MEIQLTPPSNAFIEKGDVLSIGGKKMVVKEITGDLILKLKPYRWYHAVLFWMQRKYWRVMG